MSAPDLSPLFALRLRTPRLELRLPAEEELVRLAHVAARGVHPPDEMPFLVPWTDGIGRASFVDDFVAFHRGLRERWRPDAWVLELGVWAEGELAGVQGLRADGFAARRTVASGSWLGQAFQGRGYGTEMRTAVLELAFSGLGAVAALSGALDGNRRSARVSERLGYARAGVGVREVRGEERREQRFRLDRERWAAVEHVPVELAGLEPCLPLLGASPGLSRRAG